VARKRPNASDVVPPELICLDGGLSPRGAVPALTRAEADALRRSAPLTHQQLRNHLKGVPIGKLREI
jgi:hypothetical protein